MKKPFVCNGKRFATLDDAKAYAERLFKTRGIIVAIEER